ncbi:MAG: ABC transporter ATP-binding protein [Armatimonadota bacterium]|nr:ABC transporter ATP-binding protein [Armatimonadota bacterium]MDR7532045.1 ABC transporter ATP-binding protein [Armatimonadota bacterium]MDR7535976.1 ABC transporter ATP-binding protein [Armatimonadota bacterium]
MTADAITAQRAPTRIEVEGVRKAFGSVAALADASLSVRAGEFATLIGPSGCGKTTLLKMLAGLVFPDEGQVRIDGRRVTGPGRDRSLVFQDFALLPWATVLSNVAFGLELQGVPRHEREARARAYIRKVKLAGFEHHYPHQLSGGMQQRVGLARALATRPQILLMDEPFASVDEQTRRLFQDDLLRLVADEGTTVVFVTHSMEEAVYLSDRVHVMSARPGRVLEALDVPLPRPRTDAVRRRAEFTDLVERLWAILKELQ